MRRAGFLALVLAALTLTAGPAQADKPLREEFELDIVTDTDYCGFLTQEHVVGRVIRTTYTDSEGTVTRVREVYPGYKVDLTNAATGASIHINSPGPGFWTYHADGSSTLVGTGPWIFGSDPDTGAPGYFLLKGRFVLETAADGSTTFSRVGHVEGLCDKID